MKNKTKRIVLIVLCVVLALILAALIFVAAYAEIMFSKINRIDGSSSQQSGNILTETYEPESKPENVEGDGIPQTTPTETAAPIVNEEISAFLLVGADLGGGRSDAVILCAINPNTKEISLISFQRDTYVNIPDYFPHKLNTAFSLGKYDTLVSTLEYNFGTQIDGYVGVDFNSFRQVIDALGGVEMELTEEEADHMNYRYGYSLQTGLNHLTGDEALNYVRIRAIDGTGDLARTNRQRQLLTQLINKAKSLSLPELNDLLTVVLPLITTDLGNSEIISYSLKLFPVLTDATVNSYQIPMEDTYHLDWVEQDGGMSIIEIDDWDTNIELLNEILG